MHGINQAILGVLAFAVAGFITGGARHSIDPEISLAFSWGCAGLGLVLVVAGGVAIGIQLSRK